MNAVLVVYDMNSSKTEHKGSTNISGEDAGLHSKELTPALRQGLENRKFMGNENQIGLVVIQEWLAT